MCPEDTVATCGDAIDTRIFVLTPFKPLPNTPGLRVRVVNSDGAEWMVRVPDARLEITGLFVPFLQLVREVMKLDLW